MATLSRKLGEKVAVHVAEHSGLHGVGEALHFYHQYHAVKHVRHAFVEFRETPNVQTAWTFGGNVVGVIGTERVVGALVKYGVKLAFKSHKIDVDSGNDMVAAMKAKVPVDTGRLLNGIVIEENDGEQTITASAVHGEVDGDYSRFVEFGTKGGGTVADESFFENGADAGKALRAGSSRGGVGSPAQPFFWNSAHEVADKREIALELASDEAAKEEGL